jgi:outer membrane protein
MLKRLIAVTGVLAALLLTTAAARANTFVGLQIGVGTWQQSLSGDVASGAEDVDLERDLDLGREWNNLFYAALEHPLPLLPNVRVEHARISADGRNALTREFTFRGETFAVSDDVVSDVSLTQTDLVLYYEVLDNVVSLDLGLAARWVDGEVDIVSATTATSADFDGVLPLLYGRARVDLPFTGLWAGAQAMGLAYDGHRLFDAGIQVGWTSPPGLGVELGWRTLRLKIDDIDDIDGADIDVSGPYAALHFHF